MKLVCPICKTKFTRCAGHVNRSRKIGSPVFCGKDCFGISRRKNKTIFQKKEEKRIYDEKYREKNLEMLKAKKRAYHTNNYDPKTAAVYRKKRMPLHVEYCRQPKYKEWKKKYDSYYRATKLYGDFSESFLLLQDIEKEVDSRMSRYEIYQANGTLNKHQTRRREYEKLISQHA